jgi:hypothetical protein
MSVARGAVFEWKCVRADCSKNGVIVATAREDPGCPSCRRALLRMDRVDECLCGCGRSMRGKRPHAVYATGECRKEAWLARNPVPGCTPALAGFYRDLAKKRPERFRGGRDGDG